MTNLTAFLTLTLTTNWTGVLLNSNELGYVATNHEAKIVYDGTPYTFPLKVTGSTIAAWRPAIVHTNVYLTNHLSREWLEVLPYVKPL